MASQHPRPNVTPTLGRIVIYRGTAYPSPPFPAIVAAVHDPDSHLDDQPELAGHVHLVVFDLGGQGGTRTEFDVTEDEHSDGLYTESEQSPGTWRWPAR